VKNIKILVSSLCFLLISTFAFAGCNISTASYTYTNVQTAYNQLLADNEDVFNSAGEVEIVYSNSVLNNAISSNVESTQFGKLSSNVTKNYAIFEPTFKASLLVVNKYINNSYPESTVFDTKQTTDLYNKLMLFKDALEKFSDAKTYLDNKTDFTVTGATEKFWRDELFERFYKMIDASSSFAVAFANIYSSRIFIDTTFNSGSRYTIGKTQLEYLTKLAEFAQITTKTTLSTNYEEVIDSSFEMPLSNIVLTQYLRVSSYSIWQGDSSVAITTEEQNSINSFTAWLNNDSTFTQINTQFLYAVSQYPYKDLYEIANTSNVNFTTNQQACYEKITSFINTECVNMISYIQSFTTKLLTYLTS